MATDPRIITRPLDPAWTESETRNRRGSPFSASWTDTLELLRRETGMLNARLVVLQIAVTEDDLRRDGLLRANTRVTFPGVRVAFDTPAQGPLMFATDAYPHWQANVRAVALGLEALRKVDRYGITKRGEQYRGWQALPAGGTGKMTRQEAADLLVGGLDGYTAVQLLNDPAAVRDAHRILTKRHHPDLGGDTDLFAQINEARHVLLGGNP